jgi:hypothetical protein
MAAFASSYIPTAASQVTRNADAASMTGVNFSSWYRQDQGTLYAEFLRPVAPAALNMVAQIQRDGTNRHTIFFTTSGPGNIRGLTSVNDAVQADVFTGVLTSTLTPSRAAYGYQVNNFIAAANGTLSPADTSGTVPDALDQIWFGRTGAAGGHLNGHIRKVAYYPVKLGSSQLQALTS